jgi:hypothetical protein
MYPIAINMKSGNTTFIENKKSLIQHNFFTPKISEIFYPNIVFVEPVVFQSFDNTWVRYSRYAD